MIHAVIFDWGGTLTPWHVLDYRDQWDTFAAAYGTLACARRDLAGRLVTEDRAMWDRMRSELTSETLDDLLARVGLPTGPARDSALEAYYDWWVPHGITTPDVSSVWSALKERGLAIGVLSNTIWPRPHHRGLFERDGVADLIDADVYSSEVAWTKPHPEIFRETARRLGVDPTACVYVGDRLYEDVQGAHAAGMRAVWIPREGVPDDQLVATEATPDATITSLDEVLALVDAWRA